MSAAQGEAEVSPSGEARPDPKSLAAYQLDFDGHVDAIDATAREWGIRPDSREGKFVSAFLGSARWLGQVAIDAQANTQALWKANRDLAQLEYAKAEQLAKATNATLSQARSALINLQIEKENLATIMVEKTMPLFAEKMQKVLVKKVEDERSMLKLRRTVLSGLGAVAIFLAGYGLHAWEEGRTVASMESKATAMESCLAHQLPGQGSGQGRFYCDVTAFREAGR